MSSQPQLTAQDAVQVAQQAMQRCNDLETTVAELEDYIEQLEDRIVELEAQTPDTSDYAELDRDTKVGVVRKHLVERAQQTNGKAAIEYDDVQWGVFDGEPSADHCYTLMEIAGQTEGFNYDESSTGKIRLTVDMGRTKTNTAFSHANNER